MKWQAFVVKRKAPANSYKSAFSTARTKFLKRRAKLCQKFSTSSMATYSVYYMKAEFFGKGVLGYDWLRGKSLLPDPADLGKTHVFMTLIEGRNPEDRKVGVRPANCASLSPAKAYGIPQCRSAILRLTTVRASRLSLIGQPSGFWEK
jgi:hypothetical protein